MVRYLCAYVICFNPKVGVSQRCSIYCRVLLLIKWFKFGAYSCTDVTITSYRTISDLELHTYFYSALAPVNADGMRRPRGEACRLRAAPQLAFTRATSFSCFTIFFVIFVIFFSNDNLTQCYNDFNILIYIGQR